MRLTIGMLGYGTVGTGFLMVLRCPRIQKMLAENDIALNVISASVKDTTKKLPFPVELTSHPSNIINNPAIDIVIETTGAVDEMEDLAVSALKQGKHFVTSNKALVALYYPKLTEAARQGGAQFLFEASVGGGVPIIRVLREHPEPIYSIRAVVNGTVNFILDRMKRNWSSFDASLQWAQRLGYAEQNPEHDINGLDSAYKLAILATVACGKYVNPGHIPYRGVQETRNTDILAWRVAQQNLEMKLVATMATNENGQTNFVVQPELVPSHSFLGSLAGIQNGFAINNSTYLYGEGAGALPTGWSIFQDILEITTKTPVQHR